MWGAVAIIWFHHKRQPPMNQAIQPLAARVSEDARAVAMGRQVLEIEAAAVAALARRLGNEFSAAVALIRGSHGRVIVSGIGKSGHIARKLAATFASTGTPAYFVHAAEAVHGDLGMITRDDVLIAISNSGENDELLTIVPLVKRLGGKLIAITGNEASSLAQEADIHLDARVDQEGDAAGVVHQVAAARHAVQESVARRGDTPPAALDADAIAALLERGGDGDASLAREVRELFAAADAATYAGGRADPGLVGTWEVRVDALLRELEGRT